MTRLLYPLLTSAALGLSAIMLASCGGGGGSNNNTNTVTIVNPPVAQGPTYTQGVFAPRANFVAQCAAPRSGNDPDGNRYPDRTGSTLIEKFWLRSWSNETYLWNDEIEDRNPNSIASRIDYFNVLKTNELSETGSMREKDDFHFSETTEEFFDRRNSVATSGYGVRFAFIQSAAPNREIRVLYTEPNSPASAVQNGEVNFQRGALLVAIDGEDVINGSDTDTLNNGLFPATAGEEHTFTVRDPGASADRTFTITSEDVAPSPVNRTEIINTASGKVGYMLFNTFSPFESERSLNEAFTMLESESIDDLVLDLRYNGGGLVAVAAQLGYMVAGSSRTAGKTASLLQYNDDAGNTNPVTGNVVEPIPFIDEGVGFSVTQGTALATVDLPRVYILTTGRTCSASELVINSLRGIDYDVVVIGDTTCGKPYGFLPTDNCGQTYYTIQFRSLNDKGFGDYSDGFSPQDTSNQFSEKSPGCTIADNVSNTSAELGDENEALLSAALYYRENGMCPVATSKTESWIAAKSRNDVLGLDGLQIDDPLDDTINSFLDATMPATVKNQ